jgi:hypothetical protein
MIANMTSQTLQTKGGMMEAQEQVTANMLGRVKYETDMILALINRQGCKAMGSMNVADLLYKRNSLEWKVAERLAYFHMMDKEVTVDIKGYVL